MAGWRLPGARGAHTSTKFKYARVLGNVTLHHAATLTLSRCRFGTCNNNPARAAATAANSMADGDIEGWRSIPIQHQELDPDFQIVPQQRVSAYLGTISGRRTVKLPPAPQPVTLDGDLLLDQCSENYPGDVYGANLRSKNINKVAVEDAPFFISLSSLDLSDNNVSVEEVAAFPALRVLSLQCNSVSAFCIPADAFGRLERLDLSFNHVPPDSVAALAAVPNLLELDVSSNSLPSLPDMTGFVKLRKLNAGRNNLRDDVFDHLARASSLAELILEHNQLLTLGAIIRAAADAADAMDTGGYNGPWAALQKINVSANRLTTLGGLEVLPALPALAELVVTGNEAVENRVARAAVYNLQQTFDNAGVDLVVGRIPLYQKPKPKMVSAYAAAADSMVTVTETVQQNEYATNPDLWHILDSDEEEPDSAAVTERPAELIPPQYEIDEDGFKTAADMRAAYAQLRHVLSHPQDFMMDAEAKAKRRAARAGPKLSSNSGPAAAERLAVELGAGQQDNQVAERLTTMEQMLATMKERVATMEDDMSTGGPQSAARLPQLT
eukprot:SAG31_NODE_190_length_20810_cov_20.296364_6_plen_554_part_00